jgi:hypothetical protein
LEPGKAASGSEATKAFVEATMALRIAFGSRTVVEADELALHFSEWACTRRIARIWNDTAL